MSSVSILVLPDIGDILKKKMASIDPRLKILDGTEVCDLVANFPVERTDSQSKRKFEAWLSEIEILYGFAPPSNLIARAPRLKWIHVPYAGVDRFLLPDIIKSNVLLTNSRGIHGTQVSEAAFEMLLMLARKALLFFQLKNERKWQRASPALLWGKTVGVLGVGVIGSEVARLGKAFGMKVLALEIRPPARKDLVDEIYAPAELKAMLGKCDYIVVCLPLTAETRNLIGEAEFRSMKSTAYFVNVARGPIVDESALVRALSENWIAGAGIDVAVSEPLPPSSPLWDSGNLILYPHIAGDRPDYHELAVDLFAKNMRNYLAGKELFNLIDKQKGYNAGPLVIE
jgi:D-2-hydroxyacid dehydrogenase (NADP+)